MTHEEFVALLKPHSADPRCRPAIDNGIDPAEWVDLVWKVVTLHHFHQDADRDDAAQAAFVQLIRAAQIWDPDHTRRAGFITYAWKCLCGAVMTWRQKAVGFRRPRGVRLHLFSECGPDFVSGSNRVFATVPPPNLDRLEGEDCAELLGSLSKVLGPRERDVVRMYHGLGGFGGMAYRAIGRELGLSVERVRQIETGAFRKLRDELERRQVGVESRSSSTHV